MSAQRYYTRETVLKLLRCTMRLLAAIVTMNSVAMENVFTDVNVIHDQRAAAQGR